MMLHHSRTLHMVYPKIYRDILAAILLCKKIIAVRVLLISFKSYAIDEWHLTSAGPVSFFNSSWTPSSLVVAHCGPPSFVFNKDIKTDAIVKLVLRRKKSFQTGLDSFPKYHHTKEMQSEWNNSLCFELNWSFLAFFGKQNFSGHSDVCDFKLATVFACWQTCH